MGDILDCTRPVGSSGQHVGPWEKRACIKTSATLTWFESTGQMTGQSISETAGVVGTPVRCSEYKGLPDPVIEVFDDGYTHCIPPYCVWLLVAADQQSESPVPCPHLKDLTWDTNLETGPWKRVTWSTES